MRGRPVSTWPCASQCLDLHRGYVLGFLLKFVADLGYASGDTYGYYA